MIKLNPGFIWRALLLFGCFLIGFVLISLARSNIDKAERERVWKQTHDAFVSDPVVKDLIDAANATCLDSNSFVWACGAVLQFDGTGPNKFCSTREEPLFAGSLNPNEFEFGLTWGWADYYEIPLASLRPCEYDPLKENKNCAGLIILGDKSNRRQLVPLPHPWPLPIDPDLSQVHNPNSYSVHKSEAWAQLEGMPVSFDFTKFLSRLDSDIPPHNCQLGTHHPKFSISISLIVPCSRIFEWKTLLRDTFSAIEQRVESYDPNAICSKPPKKVRFNLNSFNDATLKRVRDWKNNQN